MNSIRLIHCQPDHSFASAIGDNLALRGFQVRIVECDRTDPAEVTGTDSQSAVIAMLPHEQRSAVNYDNALAALRLSIDSGQQTFVLLRGDDVLPSWALREKVAIVRTTETEGFDRMFEDLFRQLIGPIAPWTEVVVRPSILNSPIGVAWYLDDLWATDDSYGHVVHIQDRKSFVAIPGLDDPQQIHLDKTKLLVANKGANQVLRADTNSSGAVSNIASMIDADTQTLVDMSRPNSVHQAQGYTLIANTDAHEVLATDRDPWREDVSWHALKFADKLRYPCGVCIGPRHWFVADTFNQQIYAGKVGDLESELTAVHIAGDESVFPVALAVTSDGKHLIVSDEHNRRVLFAQIDATDDRVVLTPIHALDRDAMPSNGSAVPFGTPGGLSVNRDNRLAVADRQLSCVWLISIDAMLSDATDSVFAGAV